MGNQRVQTRVPESMAERIDDYQDRGDYLNQGEAVRALIREGLEEVEKSDLESEIEQAEAEIRASPDTRLTVKDSMFTAARAGAAFTILLGSMGALSVLTTGPGPLSWSLTVSAALVLVSTIAVLLAILGDVPDKADRLLMEWRVDD